MSNEDKLFSCIVCGGTVTEKKKLFSKKIICNECKTEYEYHDDKKGYTFPVYNSTKKDFEKKHNELKERFPPREAYLSVEDIKTVNNGQLTSRERQVKERMEKEQAFLEKVSNGDFSELPESVMSNISIILKKNETPLIALADVVTLVEERVRYTYQGGSSGVSLRIMKGVSYRVGGFKGERVPVEEQKIIDVGSLVITNKRVIFTGPKKSTSFNINKIIGIEVYDDGIRVNREGKQKAEYFYASVEIQNIK